MEGLDISGPGLADKVPRIFELGHLCGRHVHRQVPELALTASFDERADMLTNQRCPIQRICALARNNVVAQMLKIEFPVVPVLSSSPLIKIDEYNEVGNELRFLQLLLTRTLRHVDPVRRWAVARFYLDKKFPRRVGRVNQQVTTGEVCSQSSRVVCRDSVHPALRRDSGFSYSPVGLVLSDLHLSPPACPDV